jgi:unsaturated rhamnogalacturonyl hydrolase
MKLAKAFWVCFCLLCLISNSIYSQNNTLDKKETVISDQLKWSERMAFSIMKRYPKAWQIDNLEKPKWEYKPSFVLFSFDKLNQKNPNKIYKDYIKNYLDVFIDSTGTITHYEQKDFNIDFILSDEKTRRFVCLK